MSVYNIMETGIKYRTVYVKDLQIGDELSTCVVTCHPFDSCKCPKGKINLEVRYPNGKIYSKVWGKYTTVGIKTKS